MTRAIASGYLLPLVPPSVGRGLRVLEDGWADERRVAARGESR
jgi:hypothetical protein